MMLQEIPIYSNISNPSNNPKHVSCSPTKVPQTTLIIVTLNENQNKSQPYTLYIAVILICEEGIQIFKAVFSPS